VSLQELFLNDILKLLLNKEKMENFGKITIVVNNFSKQDSKEEGIPILRIKDLNVYADKNHIHVIKLLLCWGLPVAGKQPCSSA
jgi:hypothetical protein